MSTMEWTIRKTFIEIQEAETQACRPRAVSDFGVIYAPVLGAISKVDEYEVESAASTSIGSWADESDNERESIVAEVADNVNMDSGSCKSAPCWPALHMMQYSLPLGFSPPASPSRQEAPILPKPVQEQRIKKGEIRTTVMIRNMPNNYTRKMLMDLLDLHGFAACYDFLYLPIDFETKACLGYAFINMVSPVAADSMFQTFDGFSNWSIPSRKVAGVSWSGPHQGLQAHIERYRNSSIMSDATVDDYKPIILCNGIRVPFPAATRKLRASRQGYRR